MSVNFTQNPDYSQQQGNFGATNAPMPDAPMQYSMLKGMGLPTNAKEAVEWSPYFLSALGLSKLISDGAMKASRLNPLKKDVANITVAESFEKSQLGKLSNKIDTFLLPHINKHSGKINAVKSAISKYTPNWVKNAFEKIQIGVTPRNTMALGQYRGCTVMASDGLFKLIKDIPSSEWARLGIKDMSDILSTVNGQKANTIRAVEQISNRLAKVSAKELQGLKLANGKSAKFLNELNKVKSFVGLDSKTAVSKYLKKGTMYASEAAGGGVIGGGLFGLVMNSVFLASTIKRTWNAPWGDKLSTFMEGALVEFCGGYLMMLLGTRLTYKLLGIKNIDKTATQIRSIKGLTQGINTLKGRYTEATKLQKLILEGPAAESLFSKLIRKIKGVSFEDNLAQRIQGLFGNISRYKNLSPEYTNAALTEIINKYPSMVNKSIDKLAKMRKFQANGQGFFRKLFNRPIRWIGNCLSVGLENLPTKIATKGTSRFGIAWHSFVNKFKSCAGYPIRFALVAMVVTPPLTKLMGKISHTLFGKPKKSIVDEMEGEKEEPKQVEPQMDKMEAFSTITKQLGQMKEAAQPTKLPPNYNPQMSQNLINSAVNAQKTRTENDKSNISPATYVPIPVGIKTTDTDVLDVIDQKIAQSHKIEQHAMKELSSLKSNKDPYKL